MVTNWIKDWHTIKIGPNRFFLQRIEKIRDIIQFAFELIRLKWLFSALCTQKQKKPMPREKNKADHKRSCVQRGKGEQLHWFITTLHFLSSGPWDIFTSIQQIPFLSWLNLGRFLCACNYGEIYFVIFIKDFSPIIPCTSPFGQTKKC